MTSQITFSLCLCAYVPGKSTLTSLYINTSISSKNPNNYSYNSYMLMVIRLQRTKCSGSITSLCSVAEQNNLEELCENCKIIDLTRNMNTENLKSLLEHTFRNARSVYLRVKCFVCLEELL